MLDTVDRVRRNILGNGSEDATHSSYLPVVLPSNVPVDVQVTV
jgi:hypothetical protein